MAPQFDFCLHGELFDYYRLINQKKGIAQCYSNYFFYFCKVEITKHTYIFKNYKTMDLVQQIIERAKSNKQRIVLPEATEERTLRAADMVLAEGVADIILIGNPGEINSLAEQWGLKNIDKATIVDPENNPKSEEYAALLAELRKKKGMTIEQARELVKIPLYL